MIHLVATSHGTDNPQGREAVNLIREQLTALVEAQAPGTYTVHEAYVDVQEPALPQVLQALPSGATAVLVPLLLSPGYHTEHDMRKAATDASHLTTTVARALGPSAALAKLQRQRLEEAGWDGYDDIALAAAGSSRADGREAVLYQAEVFSTLLSREVPYGFIADIEPTIEEAWEANQAEYISTYLLARGYFHSKLIKAYQGTEKAAVTEPLVLPGDAASAAVVASVALERATEALAALSA